MKSSVEAKQIFVSYAPTDRAIAHRIAERLKSAGLRVWFDEWEIGASESFLEKINSGLEASDLILVLLSPDAVDSRWVTQEWTSALARELDYRAINVVPAIVRDCVVPRLLASRQLLDLRNDLDAGIDRLTLQLGASVAIDFDLLSAQQFERLVVDLLESVGFSVELTPAAHDGAVDIIARVEREDPFGVKLEEQWMVQARLYRHTRVGVSFLRETVGILNAGREFDRALIVTTGQLTSIANEFLDSTSRMARARVRVVEGTELRRLLLQHPSVARKYFPAEAT